MDNDKITVTINPYNGLSTVRDITYNGQSLKVKKTIIESTDEATILILYIDMENVNLIFESEET